MSKEEIFPEDIIDETDWQAAQQQDDLLLQQQIIGDLVSLFYDATRYCESHLAAEHLHRSRNIAAALGLLKEFNNIIGGRQGAD